MKRAWIWVLSCVASSQAGCGEDGGDPKVIADASSTAGVETSSSSGAGSSSSTEEGSSSTSSTTSSTSTGAESSSSEGVPSVVRFDLGALPDLPQGAVEAIPTSCLAAEAGASTVGCRFYSVDMDQYDGGADGELAPFAVVASNVQLGTSAHVTFERKTNGSWSEVDSATIPSLGLYAFQPPDFHQEGSGIMVGGAYRVTSNVPIVAYQFNPLDGANSYTSDASMLYPVPTLDTLNHVVGWPAFSGLTAYVTIVGTANNTTVQVTPSVATAAGTGVQALSAGQTGSFTIDEGDVLQLATSAGSMTGTRIDSGNKPVAVFSGHECTNIGPSACDHLEEQMAGLRRWGETFVAAHMPQLGPNDQNYWHIYASEDNTSIELSAEPGVVGVPVGVQYLNSGQFIEFTTSGPANNPGDFYVEANKPIAVQSYMSNSGGQGDPCMLAHSPVEQYLPRYVVLVPPTWVYDYVVVVRQAGASIEVNGANVPDSEFIPAGPDHEVARLLLPDGVYLIESNTGFEVLGVGFDFYDSYCYLGGTGTGVINPFPQAN